MVAPLIAVVGDFFIEAQMVPYAETMQGYARQRLASFGSIASRESGRR